MPLCKYEVWSVPLGYDDPEPFCLVKCRIEQDTAEVDRTVIATRPSRWILEYWAHRLNSRSTTEEEALELIESGGK